MTVMLNNIEVTGDPEKRNLTDVWLKGLKQNKGREMGDKCQRISGVFQERGENEVKE